MKTNIYIFNDSNEVAVWVNDSFENKSIFKMIANNEVDFIADKDKDYTQLVIEELGMVNNQLNIVMIPINGSIKIDNAILEYSPWEQDKTQLDPDLVNAIERMLKEYRNAQPV